MTLSTRGSRPALLAAAALLSTASAPAAATAGAATPLASAACKLDGGGDQSEWTATITGRVKITCAGAKSVLRTCDREGRLPSGWKVTVSGGTVRLRKRSAGKRFKVTLAGGAPSCIGAAGEG